MDATEEKIMSILAESPKTTPQIAAAIGRNLQYAYAKCMSLMRYGFIIRRVVPGFFVHSRAGHVALWSKVE